MTTYNTYQEAKIANPESNIYIQAGKFLPERSIRPSPWTYDFRGLALCNPADYCMTVEEFLADGNKLEFTDIIACSNSSVVSVANWIMDGVSKYYILRAAALEEKEPELTKDDSPQGVISAISNRLHNMSCEHQDSELGEELGSMACDIWGVLPMISNESIEEEKPRTKVEYEPCHFADAWEPVKAYCNGDELFDGDKNKVACPEVALNLWIHGNLYRRTKTPMTERELFVDWFESIHEVYVGSEEYDHGQLGEFLFDNGCKQELTHRQPQALSI